MARGRLGCPGCFPSQPAGSPGLGEGVRHGETPRFPEALDLEEDVKQLLSVSMLHLKK